ncbi:MAG: Tfp pilus assembly protein FimT/FimU [Sedimentibacter sp.]
MNNKGFSLIELIVTISILSIVFALVVPKLDSGFAYLDKMANEFTMDVRYVQMESMKKPASGYKISIDKSKGCYYVYKNTVVEKTVEFEQRYNIDYTNANMDTIGFTYEGMPVNAGTFSILDTKTNEIKEVSIVPTTGRTIIKE